MTLSFIKKLTLSLSAILFLWLIIHSAVIIADGLNDELEVVDAAVVLGNKVELNGQPSDRLQARLDKAAEPARKAGMKRK